MEGGVSFPIVGWICHIFMLSAVSLQNDVNTQVMVWAAMGVDLCLRCPMDLPLTVGLQFQKVSDRDLRVQARGLPPHHSGAFFIYQI